MEEVQKYANEYVVAKIGQIIEDFNLLDSSDWFLQRKVGKQALFYDEEQE